MKNKLIKQYAEEYNKYTKLIKNSVGFGEWVKFCCMRDLTKEVLK